jgi:hypothetical protein
MLHNHILLLPATLAALAVAPHITQLFPRLNEANKPGNIFYPIAQYRVSKIAK